MGSNPTPGTNEPEPLGRYVFADRLERRRWRFLICSGTLFVLMVGALAFVTQPVGHLGRLVVHRAAVQARGPHASALVPVDRDSRLGGGEEIRTGSSGSASIEYFDGSTTDLDADTAFKVLEISSAPERPTIAGRLIDGRVWNAVRTAEGGRFEIRIEHAWVLGSRGSHLIDCDRTSGCVVVGLEGSTRVDVDGGSSIGLGEGRCVEVDGVGRAARCDDALVGRLCVDLGDRVRAIGCPAQQTPDPVVTSTPDPTPTPSPVRVPTPQPAPAADPAAPATSTAAGEPSDEGSEPAEDPPNEADPRSEPH